MSRIRVALPAHLRSLARVGSEVEIEVEPPLTIGALVDALERDHPVLRGTIREHGGRRRAYMRYFACGLDLSHEPEGSPLPGPVASGGEPFTILGAIAGG